MPIIKDVASFIEGEILKISPSEIDLKSRNSLVSYVDKTAEERLVNGLSKLIPKATFLTEEETIEQQPSDLRWIIDPLDGTTNYLHKLPCYSISVALEMDGNIAMGLIYDIPHKNCFYSWRQGGAWCDKKKISVSKNVSIDQSLIATGFPYYDYDSLEAYMEILKALVSSTRGVRRFGSAALDLAYTACGHFDGFYEYSLNAWDVAAGVVIIEEAGGLVTSFSGDDQYINSKSIVAANPVIHTYLMDVIRKYMSFV
jgi:myo-inositol-1(or 4)-monophosphatase